MNFPSYVPKVIKDYVRHYVEGTPKLDWEGWIACINQYQQRIVGVEDALKNPQLRTVERRKLLAELHDTQDGLNRFQRDVDCLTRLACDKRMAEVYPLVKSIIKTDKAWERLISSAWHALADYGQYRDSMEQAIILNEDIRKTAEKLSFLLNKLYDTGVNIPDEFCHIPSLIESSCYPNDSHSYYIWDVCKKYTVGNFSHNTNHTPQQRGIINHLRYSWEKAPPVSMLLDTMVSVAEEYEPSFQSEIAATATSSRKRNHKSDYIRAYCKLLMTKDFELSGKLINSIAIICNVVINEADIDVSSDDVRKIVEKLKK